MAQRKTRNDRLEDAIAQLIRAQATLAQQQTVLLARISETDKELVNLRRQANEQLARIISMLIRHEEILTELPDAIRQKIGFKPKEQCFEIFLLALLNQMP
jgi:predicted  nucleic acid-binding Zn-ribbon protein